MIELAQYLRSSHREASLQTVLQLPVTALLGVTEAAREALAGIGIQSIFDLGASSVFAKSGMVAEASKVGTVTSDLGMAPSDWFAEDAESLPLSDLGHAPLEALRDLSAADADRLKQALDVDTIRDFANWPPRRIAHDIVSKATGSTVDAIAEPGDELKPRLGEYPTERVYYDKLVMLWLNGEEETAEIDGPISLAPAIDQPFGFGKPAVGALLTYSQSWYAKGVTLGQMLHSLALAPGEATRVAVIDWSRRTRARVSETIAETEALDTATRHSRALSEVQNAVATEMQEGESMTSGWAVSSSEAVAYTTSSGLLGSLFMSGSDSVSFQEARSRSGARSTSWSVGNRSVLAEMSQNINDRTDQHSNSVRNRRATAVREVAQSEHEEISTRIVANYNHMHALTVQYYEVVQVYRVATALHKAVRCLFIPFELPDFSGTQGNAVIERFRPALIDAALTSRVRDLLLDETTSVAITPAANTRLPDPPFNLDHAITPSELASAEVALFSLGGIAEHGEESDAKPAPKPPTNRQIIWSGEAISRVSHELGRRIVRRGSNSIYLPDETVLFGISFVGLNLAKVRLERAGPGDNVFEIPADSARVDMPPGIRLRDIEGILVSRAANDSLHAGAMTLHCSYQGRPFAAPEVPLQFALGTQMQKVLTLRSDTIDRQKELQSHLAENATYYGQTILASLNSATLLTLLSGFRLEGRPIIDQIEPNVIAVAGNYIVLRAPTEADEPSGVIEGGENLSWGEVLAQRNLDKPQEDARTIPIPTDGVFAEAVLGRSNAAEKLDITRFWNWQDSPIPLQPTEIAPVGTGSRGMAENLEPGQLGTPVLNIVNPTSLPDPAGLSASLSALATSNMFRDMSGLAGTQSLAQEALGESLAAATEAGKLASTNLQTEAQKAVAMGQIAADIAKAAMGVPPTDSTEGISADGARINHGRDLDNRKKEGAKGSGQGSGDTEGEGSGVPADDGGQSPQSSGHGDFSRESAYADKSALGFSPAAVDQVNAKIAEYQQVFASSGGGDENSPDLGVTRKQIQAYDYLFNDKKKSRRQFKKLVIDAANKFDLNPGLLAVNLIRETLYVDYLKQSKISSFLVGVDDYYEKRHDIKAKVANEKLVKWDRTQTPTTDENETGRTVKTIKFDSGPDALMASAAYLKHGEIVLREEAESLSENFDLFNAELRFALSRLAFNAGLGRAKKNMKEFIVDGKDVLIRKPQSDAGPQRNATIAAAQAIHLSTTVFGVVP